MKKHFFGINVGRCLFGFLKLCERGASLKRVREGDANATFDLDQVVKRIVCQDQVSREKKDSWKSLLNREELEGIEG